MKSQAWQEAGSRGLTPTQSQLLALLSSSADSPLRLSQIAEGLAVTSATASDIVATLVDKGLVQKDRDKDDARAIAITLTEQGQQEASKVAKGSDFLLTAVNQLSPQEQEIFYRGLLKVIRFLQESRQVSVSKMCVTCRFFQPHVYADPQCPHHCAYVDAPFGDRDLRLECPEHLAAKPNTAARNWQAFCQ